MPFLLIKIINPTFPPSCSKISRHFWQLKYAKHVDIAFQFVDFILYSTTSSFFRLFVCFPFTWRRLRFFISMAGQETSSFNGFSQKQSRINHLLALSVWDWINKTIMIKRDIIYTLFSIFQEYHSFQMWSKVTLRYSSSFFFKG